MIITVRYCKYVRNDGTFNTITFDTEAKEYSNTACSRLTKNPHMAFVEAQMSRDIDELRELIVKEGYNCID